MNNFQICKDRHILFNGFTVQPGMLFKLDLDGNSIITNGNLIRNGYYIYTDENCLDGEFACIHITQESHTKLFSNIQKGLRLRKRKGLDGVIYRTPAQLEMERWTPDATQKIFKAACIPVGKTPKAIAGKHASAMAKYNSMKERGNMTQRVDYCRYNSTSSYAEII